MNINQNKYYKNILFTVLIFIWCNARFNSMLWLDFESKTYFNRVAEIFIPENLRKKRPGSARAALPTRILQVVPGNTTTPRSKA